MNTLFLMAQGALVGFVAGLAFPGFGWEFFAAIIANSALTVAYGATKGN